MDFDSYIMSTGYVDDEIAKINQKIVNVTNQVTSGIKSITQQNGNQLVFTLNDNTTIALTVTGLSQENYTTVDKNKLALLNSDILSQFTYVNNSLLFNGNTVENNKLDLSNYYNKTEMNSLLNTKANTSHIHGVSDVTDLENELNNRYIKTDTMSKSEIQVLVNSIIKNMTWKDSVTTMDELNALTGMTIGETRIVTSISTIYTYNGTMWINLGSSANIPLATITNDGQMSKEDKAKLDSIIVANLITNTDLASALSSKADVSSVPTKTSQITNDSDFATNVSVDGKIANFQTELQVNTKLIDYAKLTDLSNKLVVGNIKAGSNISVTVSGNDVTINSTATGGTIDMNTLPTF